MAKKDRISLSDREAEAKEAQPVNELFKKTEKENREEESRIRRTYVLPEYLAKAINLYAAMRNVDKNVIVREALEASIPEDIQEQAKKI